MQNKDYLSTLAIQLKHCVILDNIALQLLTTTNMKILVIIAISIISFFILTFFVGMIFAAILGRGKNRDNYAIGLYAKLPEELRMKIIKIFSSHKNGDINEINNITNTITRNDLNYLLKLISPQNRPIEFSAGKIGDRLSWEAMENDLQTRNYSVNSSKIITGIILNNLDEVLSKITKK